MKSLGGEMDVLSEELGRLDDLVVKHGDYFASLDQRAADTSFVR